MKEVLQQCFDNLDGDYAGMGHTDWWISGAQASEMNQAKHSRIVQQMNKALNKSSMSDVKV